MAGYLIAEEGPLSGLTVRFEEGEEWILGRDPDEAGIVLEDPMVSRRHVICRLTPEGFLLENLSSVNPATQNGKVITEAVLLREGDIIQIGSTFFRFTTKDPSAETSKESEKEEESHPVFGEEQDLSSISFDISSDVRWLLKVISGPNTGAEFGMQKSSVYIIGKDPNLCDIVFQDLSVSRQHARLTVDDEETVFIEDLGSRNGVLVNGELISERRQLDSQDLVALGTTTFLVIDRQQVRETIISPPTMVSKGEERAQEELIVAKGEIPPPPKDWKEMVIPTRHLVVAAIFSLFVLGTITAMFALFKAEPVMVHEKNENKRIQEAVKNYSDIQFSYNQTNKKLFLVGHVLTAVDKQELMYLLKGFDFITTVEDNVVIDELVWQNMNALLMTNPDWIGVSIYSPVPGRFVARGYLQTNEQAETLTDYLNINFPYLDRLDNQVVIENNLTAQIESALVAKGFSGVTFQLTNGDLVLQGMADEGHASIFNKLVEQFKAVNGVRSVKNFVVYATADSSRIDLSSQYQVTGYSKKDDLEHYVVINGRILSKGDTIDGMNISSVQSDIVLLEKDGLKYKINYNLQ